jgi:hypothetical protein
MSDCQVGQSGFLCKAAIYKTSHAPEDRLLSLRSFCYYFASSFYKAGKLLEPAIVILRQLHKSLGVC